MSTSTSSSIKCRLSTLYDQIEGIEQSSDGLQGLQGFAEMRHPLNRPSHTKGKRYLQTRQPQESMGLLL